MDDVLAGAEPVSRRRRWAVAAALALLVLAGVADRVVAAREVSALQSAVLAGEQVVDASATNQAALVEYSGPLLTRESIPPAARAAALATLAQDAARWVPRVEAREQQLRALRVLPWHRDTSAAREAYGQRLRAWGEALRGVERAPATSALSSPAVRESRDRAQARLREVGVRLRR